MAGRPVGSKNTKANELKNAIIASLDRVGGIDYLVKQAETNPIAYMSLIGKVIPKDVNMGGQEDNPIELSGTIEIVHVAPKNEG